MNPAIRPEQESASIARAQPRAKRTEHVEAVTLMRVVRLHEARYPQLRLLFAVPNGGDRHVAVAAKMKAEGVKAGVPDYLLPVRSGGYIGLITRMERPEQIATKLLRAVGGVG